MIEIDNFHHFQFNWLWLDLCNVSEEIQKSKFCNDAFLILHNDLNLSRLYYLTRVTQDGWTMLSKNSNLKFRRNLK